MSDFGPAVEVVLKHEGGFVDNPNDPGGATKYGISRRFLALHGMSDEAADVEHITEDFARGIYLKFFWTPNKYDAITDQNVATKIFDAAVNMGAQQAHRLLQRALGVIGYDGIVPDGFMGSQTLTAVNKCSPDRLIQALSEEFAAFYKVLASRNPKMAEFLPNWLKRAGWSHP